MSTGSVLDRNGLTALPLAEKIRRSKEIIQEAISKFGLDKLVIAWTGGKDSTLMLWLFRETCREMNMTMPECIFIDEGDVFQEIVDHVGQIGKIWDVKVNVLKNTDVLSKAEKLGDIIRVAELNERNRREVQRIGFAGEEFPFEPESMVGNHLMKTIALSMFIENNDIHAVATAIRWDEQDARQTEGYFSVRHAPEHTRVHPVLHFRERDIWDVIHDRKLPFCPLYLKGYRSLGAKSSTVRFSDLPAWQQDLENTPERSGRGHDKEMIMAKLRDLGYM